MTRIHERLLNLGLRIPDILLPASGFEKWAVIACDQFTSRRDYWEKVREFVGESPSTLNVTLPEVYLNDADAGKRIADIRGKMSRYLEDGTLVEHPSRCMLVERTTPLSPVRTGLVIAIDLEKYDFTPGSRSLIRATEGTILERIPPRERIRSASPAEFPHVMLLMDDPARRVIEPIAASCRSLQPEYDFTLMAGGGRIRGYAIESPDFMMRIADAFELLLADSRVRSGRGQEPFLFAVGDGNHSLAAAKTVWENVKRSTDDYLHPSRFALVELLNVYDPGLVFHPIHRVLFGADPGEVLAFLERSPGVSLRKSSDRESVVRSILPPEGASVQSGCHEVGFMSGTLSGIITIRNACHRTATGALQELLDAYCAKHRDVSIDYIHGEVEAADLSREPSRIGFILPVMKKEELFPTVAAEGVLPRKAFSIGEAVEKRYYLEGRKILG